MECISIILYAQSVVFTQQERPIYPVRSIFDSFVQAGNVLCMLKLFPFNLLIHPKMGVVINVREHRRGNR